MDVNVTKGAGISTCEICGDPATRLASLEHNNLAICSNSECEHFASTNLFTEFFSRDINEQER